MHVLLAEHTHLVDYVDIEESTLTGHVVFSDLDHPYAACPQCRALGASRCVTECLDTQ